jgi:hypothetical protein
VWGFDKAEGDDKGNGDGNNDDEDTFINVEYGHDDLEEADLMMTTTGADCNDDDEGTLVEWTMWSGGVILRSPLNVSPKCLEFAGLGVIND